MPVVTLACAEVEQDIAGSSLPVSTQEGSGAIWSDGSDATYVEFGPQGVTQVRVARYMAHLDAVPVRDIDTINSLTLRVRGWWNNGNLQPNVQAYVDEVSSTPFHKDDHYPPITVGEGPRAFWSAIDLPGAGWDVDEDGIYGGVPGWVTQTAGYNSLDASATPYPEHSLKQLLRQDGPFGSYANWLVFEMWTSDNNELQTCRILEAEVIVDYILDGEPEPETVGRLPALRQVQRSDGLGLGGPPRAVQRATRQSSLRRGPDALT